MIILINLYSGLAQWNIVASHVIVSLEGVGSIFAFVQIVLYLDSMQSLWSLCEVCEICTILHGLCGVCMESTRTHGGV